MQEIYLSAIRAPYAVEHLALRSLHEFIDEFGGGAEPCKLGSHWSSLLIRSCFGPGGFAVIQSEVSLKPNQSKL